MLCCCSKVALRDASLRTSSTVMVDADAFGALTLGELGAAPLDCALTSVRGLSVGIQQLLRCR